MMFEAFTEQCMRNCLLLGTLLLPWAFWGCPLAMRPFFASHCAGGFHELVPRKG